MWIKVRSQNSKKNKIYICDRTSTHIDYQNNILEQEYNNLGLKYQKIDNWYLDREKKNTKNLILF